MAEFYPKLGDVLKKHFSGWRAYLLSADMRLPNSSASPYQTDSAFQRRPRMPPVRVQDGGRRNEKEKS
jgi:putative N6-adenine-specific DNA methylase